MRISDWSSDVCSSDLLVVAGTENAVLMVESEAKQLSEDVMLGGVVYGHEQMQAAINAIHDLVRDAGKPEWDWKPDAKNETLLAAVAAAAQDNLVAAYKVRQKQAPVAPLREVYAEAHSKVAHHTPPAAQHTQNAGTGKRWYI